MDKREREIRPSHHDNGNLRWLLQKQEAAVQLVIRLEECSVKKIQIAYSVCNPRGRVHVLGVLSFRHRHRVTPRNRTSGALEVRVSLSIDEKDGVHAEDQPSNKNNKVFGSIKEGM